MTECDVAASPSPAELAPARYFPVRDRPYRMEVGLSRLGTDFGNGAADALFFQVDSERQRYLRCKAELAIAGEELSETESQRRVHDAVISWMVATLAREHPQIAVAQPTYAAVAAVLQEDFAVVQRDESGDDRAIAVFVSFPSGWRPETILGAGFKEIHGPVPGFAMADAANASMVATMIERGPFVRFVWTITADDHLDHHPERGRREPWREDGKGWLRVERQVTVPFAAEDAALFLIRVYNYPFESLSAAERAVLRRSLEQMPAEIAAYKGLDDEVRRIAAAQLASEQGRDCRKE